MNANDPAFPSSALDRLSGPDCPGAAQRGMTLRSYFAAMPLNPDEFERLSDAFFHKYPERKEVSLQELRVANADALIKELNKTTTP